MKELDFGNSGSAFKHIAKECLHPVRVNIKDPLTGISAVREVPCGKCVNCQYRNQMQWVTRMSLECDYHKYCYYVTLTYDGLVFSKNVDLRHDVLAYHGEVYSGKSEWIPLILCRRHVSNFVLKLRDFLDDPNFMYSACGEYGDKNDRPHYHMIFWTDKLISAEDVDKLWCLKGFHLGNIDFHNLSENGTINGENGKCSAYIFKYCNKFNFEKKSRIANRLKEVYEKKIKYKIFKCRFNHIQLEKEEFKYSSYEVFEKDCLPFKLCSVRPSIGYRYFADKYADHNLGVVEQIGLSSGDVVPMPKYFKRLNRKALLPFFLPSSETGKFSSPFDFKVQAACFLLSLREKGFIEDSELTSRFESLKISNVDLLLREAFALELKDRYFKENNITKEVIDSFSSEELQVFKDSIEIYIYRGLDNLKLEDYVVDRIRNGIFYNSLTKLYWIYAGEFYRPFRRLKGEFVPVDVVSSVSFAQFAKLYILQVQALHNRYYKTNLEFMNGLNEKEFLEYQALLNDVDIGLFVDWYKGCKEEYKANFFRNQRIYKETKRFKRNLL